MDGFIKFSDNLEVDSFIEEHFSENESEYYEQQLDADSVEISVPVTYMTCTFTVRWSDSEISVADMWDNICSEYSRPHMLESREVS